MATAEELLATGENPESRVLIIDSDLRTIAIPADFGVFGVESDDDVLRVYFRGPRFYHGVDLSTFDVRVNIENASGERDLYEVIDLVAEDNAITFSWLVGRFVAKTEGTVKFSLRFVEVNDESIVSREFNTTVATGKILHGLEANKAIEFEYPDIIESILDRLKSIEENGGGGNCPVMVVTATDYDDETYDFICDHSVAEINAWVNGGGTAVLQYKTYTFHLDRTSRLVVYFIRDVPDSSDHTVWMVMLRDIGGKAFAVFNDASYSTPINNVTAQVGQTIMVKEVDSNGKPTKWESVDYQPKTHGKEIAELLPNTQAFFVEEEGMFMVECDFTLTVGNTYTINWNGTPYTCVAVDVDGVACVGNVGILLETGDSGEPFAVMALDGALLAIPLDGSAELAIGVSGEVFQTVDKKYLPSDILYGFAEYTRTTFDIQNWYYKTTDSDNLLSGTDGWEDTPVTRKQFERLTEVLSTQDVYIRHIGSYGQNAMVEPAENDGIWTLRCMAFFFDTAPRFVLRTLSIRWSDENSCMQRMFAEEGRYIISATKQ